MLNPAENSKIPALTVSGHKAVDKPASLKTVKSKDKGKSRAGTHKDRLGSRVSSPLPKRPQILKSASKTEPEKNWTVLCYFAGDNNLEEQMTRNLLDLQAKGSTPQMNILAQIDRGTEYTAQLGGKPGMVRYYLGKSDRQDKIAAQELKDLGEADASDPKVLKDFLKYGMKKYPAKNYLVFVYGHGLGVEGFITDDGKESKKAPMSLGQFQQALSGAEKSAGVDGSQVLLALESCQMGQIEAAYQFKDAASRMLSSQAPSNWNFTGALSGNKVENYDLKTMGEHLFREGKTPQEHFLTFDGLSDKQIPGEGRDHDETYTLALIDLKKLPKVKDAVIKFEKAVKKSSLPRETLQAIMEVKSRTGFYQATPACNYVSDFIDLADRVGKAAGSQDQELKKSARDLKSALEKTVLGSYHRDNLEHNKNANGLGVLSTGDPSVYDAANYQKLDFDRDTGWSGFMSSYTQGTNPREMEKKLASRSVKYPQLKEMSQLAHKGLKNFKDLEEECKAAGREIEILNKNSQLTHMEKRFLVLNKIKDLSFISRIDKINRSVESPRNQIMEAALENIAELAYSYPEQLPHLIKAGLIMLSSLDGEISAKTLTKAAQALMEDTRIETGKQEGESYAKRMLGNQLLKVFGYSARNERVFNQANNARDNFTGLLKEMGRPQQSDKRRKTSYDISQKLEKALEKLPVDYFNEWDLPRLNPLTMTRAQEVRDEYGYAGKGIGVAIVGSGFNSPGVELQGWHDEAEGENEPVDREGRGTHSGGNVLNIAPESGLTAVKVTDREGKIDPQKAARGIDWAVENRDKLGLKILQINFGSLDDFAPVKAALERAVKAGMLVLLPAGDKGPEPGTLNPLAEVPGVVTVGAAWSEEMVSDFSGVGEGKVRPDFTAPGQFMVSLSAKDSKLEKQAGDISLLRKRDLTPALKYLDAHPKMKAALQLPDSWDSVPSGDLEQMLLDKIADFKSSDLKEDIKKIPDMVKPDTARALQYLKVHPELKASLPLPEDFDSLKGEALTEALQMSLPALEIPDAGTVMGNGSEVATSLAAGAAALLWEADPALSAKEIKEILRETALDMGDEFPPAQQGKGFMDVKAAVDMALSRKQNKEK